MEINLRNIIRGGLMILFLVTFNILHYHSVDGLTKLGELRGSGAIVTSAKTYDSPSPVPHSLPEAVPQSHPARRNLSQSGAHPAAEESESGRHFIRTGFSCRETQTFFTPESSKNYSEISANTAKPELSADVQAAKKGKKTGQATFSQRQKQEIQDDTPFPFNLRFPWFSTKNEEKSVQNSEVWSPGIQPHRLTPVTLPEDALPEVISVENSKYGKNTATAEAFRDQANPVIHPIFPAVGASTPAFPAENAPDERFMEAAPVKPLRLDIQFQASTKTLPEVPERHEDANTGNWGKWRKHAGDATAKLDQMPAFADSDAPEVVTETAEAGRLAEKNLITDGIFLRPETKMYVREEVYMPTARHFGVQKPILPEDDGESDFPTEVYPSLMDFPAVENEETVPDLRSFPKEIRNFPPLEEEITEVPYQPQA